MVELGKHAVPVLAAYAVSLALIGAIVFASWSKSRGVKARLKSAEKRAADG